MARKRTIDIRQPELTDVTWERLAPLLPEPEPSPKGGPKPVPNRPVVEGILWMPRNGGRWKALPEGYPSPSTSWRRLAEWEDRGIWLEAWEAFLDDHNAGGRLTPPIEDPALRRPSLYDAIDANDFDLARRVIAADPDEIDSVYVVPPPLHCCVYGDQPDWVELLLDHGADIEHRDQDYGEPPLTAAVVHRLKRIIPILVRRGARTEGQRKNARDGLAGAYEEFFDRQGYREIVELLQTLGVEE